MESFLEGKGGKKGGERGRVVSREGWRETGGKRERGSERDRDDRQRARAGKSERERGSAYSCTFTIALH